MTEAKDNKISKVNEKPDGVEGEVMSDKYRSAQNIPGSDIPEEAKKELEKTKEKLEEFKKLVLKKYPFTLSIGILPPQSIKKFEEDEELPPDASAGNEKDKPIHIMVIIPEDNFKDIQKIKIDLIKQCKVMKPKIWLHIKTPVDVWNYCMDEKMEIVSAIAMSFPLHDKGLLGALRVAEIHKSLVLQKFEKYVVSYVIGGSLVRGTATKTSDVDIFIIINDTDVKRMPRLELKEKLRSIIYSYVAEASALAGVKNVLSPQVYILTDFWESVKDAHPVIFTFIRDGIPLYDRGTFMPWKLLLKMGKLKPSPEAIDMFMSMGDKTSEIVKRRLLDIVMGDIYWGIITPTQALLMLYGIPPPNVYETVSEMKKVFVDKEKILEKKYVDILEKIAIKYYKGYEHEKVKEVSGKEVDELLKDAEVYMKRLKELRTQIEKRAQQRTIEQIYNDTIELLKSQFGNKKQDELVRDYEKNLVKTGKAPPSYLNVLKDLIKAREQFKKGKLAKHEVEDARKNASLVINSLIEYAQRCDLVSVDKSRITILYGEKKDKKAEFLITDAGAFLITDAIKKLTDKIENSNKEELEKALASQKGKLQIKITGKIFELLKKEFGEFEIVI